MNILRFLVPKSLVAYATDDSTVRQAFEKMRFHRYVTIPIINAEGEYVGTLRNEDIFRYFLDNNDFDYRKAERDNVTAIIDPGYAKPLFHKIAPPLTGADITLGQKLIVCRFHGDQADLQMGSQRPLGGQLFPCGKMTGENIRLQKAVKTFIQRKTRLFFQFICQHRASSLLFIFCGAASAFC